MTDYRKRLEAELEEIGGCHDRDCKVFVTPGVHTNGGCRCLRDAYTGQRVFRAYKRAVDDQDAEITRLRSLVDAAEWVATTHEDPELAHEREQAIELLLAARSLSTKLKGEGQ